MTKLRASTKREVPSGVDLLRQINEGSIQKAPNEHLDAVKHIITDNCDELIEIGARIRPLMVDEQRIGWVRGFHNTERKRLSRWVHNPNDFLISTLTLATSLKREEIEEFSALEMHNMVHLVQKMTEYDVSLFPYLSAFTTTMASENLWHGHGTQLTSFENREIEMPDGAVMKIITPSEHARLWATLCVYREQAKVRLDANWNAVLQVRPMAGKSVDPLANDLKVLSKQLATDSLYLWENVVKFRPSRELDDGWAHPENMETREGMLKELHGMMAGDRHEQVMAAFEKQQIDAAEKQKHALTIPARELGINEEKVVWIQSEEEIRRREYDLKKGRVRPKPINRNKLEVEKDPVEMMKRYK
jgi:hypothetical protein